jgi:single-strand DNA-binding protein
MKNSLRNKVQLIGNLGNDPEVRQLNGGNVMAKFSIATSDFHKDKDGNKVKETYWHNLVAWGKTAQIVEKFLTKGKEVAIDGKLINRSYEDKEGVKRYVTEIVVNDLVLLGSR